MTRPAGVSTSRQFRACRSRCSSSISSVTRPFQRIRGTGPNSAPASERNEPAWMSATRVPPPRSAAQSTASLMLKASPGAEHHQRDDDQHHQVLEPAIDLDPRRAQRSSDAGPVAGLRGLAHLAPEATPVEDPAEYDHREQDDGGEDPRRGQAVPEDP